MDDTGAVAEAWDRDYEGGRYRNDPPLPFVEDLITAAKRLSLLGEAGLYIGCGNGRNYGPLVSAGLDLTGLDVSEEAIRQLASRMPERANRLVHGDISVLPPGDRYGMVLGIQVFQHGDRRTCHGHIRKAQRLVAPGGLMAVRVNAAQTDLEYAHDIIESDEGEGFTIRYLEGPKRGLLVHFFDKDELSALFERPFEAELDLRLRSTRREPPATGQWSQWEGIWMRSRRH